MQFDFLDFHHTRRESRDGLYSRKAIFVVAGVGNGSGTGAASARAFAKAGYRVALIARNPESLADAAKGIQAQGGEAGFDEIKKYWPDGEIRVALWNAASFVRKEFLELTEEEIEESTQTNIIGASAFSSGKTGQRALAQSLNKEFGPKNIHVSNVIVDGLILTDRMSGLDAYKSLLEDENKRLSPESIANSYLYLVGQDRSAWTFELDRESSSSFRGMS
ncbi:hypothetical protein RSAG8_06444, partial [Rhizoctonia solani AG-8 WAC10335]